MKISSKLRRLGKTKSILEQRKREIQERTLPRFCIVASHEEADRIKAEHAATGITSWHPLIVIAAPPQSDNTHE